MKCKKITALLLAMSLLCIGCKAQDTPANPDNTPGAGGNINSAVDNTAGQEGTCSEVVSLTTNTSDYFSDRDYDSSFDRSTAAIIYLNGNSAECISNAVQINENIITITDEGTYILSGSLDNGMIVVNAEKTDKIQLVLDAATISNETGAPIYVKQADKVFITLASGTENTLSNGGSFTAIDENNIDAVIFSKEDLTLNGEGSLTINSPGGHGIVSKDELSVTGGNYNLTVASHALSGKDNICIAGGSFVIASGKDGLHAENDEDTSLGFIYIDNGSFQIASEGDGISSLGEMLIQSGTFDIVAGGGSENATQQTSDFWGVMPGSGFGGEFGGGPGGGHGGVHGGNGGRGGSGSKEDFGGMELPNNTDTTSEDSTSTKGIKASGNLQINNGTFTIDAADDSIHSNANLLVNNGSFDIKTGDDGFHADAALVINNGATTIRESYEGLEGLSVDILGGELYVFANDDGLNAAGGNDQSGMGGPRGGDMFATDENSHINIGGGSLYINASGDGMDSNGYLTMTDGKVFVSGPNYGDTAILDYGIEATISGGTFIGIGASQMSSNFSSSSTQGALLVSADNQTGGTLVELCDADGQVLISQKAEQDFSGILLSCPDLQQGEDYTLTIGTNSTNFTMSKLISNIRNK